MHAARVPVLGIAIAVVLLVAENLGAIADRDQALAPPAPDVAETEQMRICVDGSPCGSEHPGPQIIKGD